MLIDNLSRDCIINDGCIVLVFNERTVSVTELEEPDHDNKSVGGTGKR